MCRSAIGGLLMRRWVAIRCVSWLAFFLFLIDKKAHQKQERSTDGSHILNEVS